MSNQDIILTCLGGGREIGANSYLLEWKGANILLDCGMNPREVGYKALPAFDLLYNKKIDAVVISHAHLDHVGSLTFLAENYLTFGARVFLTSPAARLIPTMCLETVKQLERGRVPMEDRYYYHHYFDRQTVRGLKRYFSEKEYGETFELGQGVSCTFFPAGHVLGSAGAVISDRTYTFVYTGDFCMQDQTLLEGASLPQGIEANALLTESTYGSDEKARDSSYEEEFEKLGLAIQGVIARGGHVLLPTFALGKAQNLLEMLRQLKSSGRIDKEIPVYVHMGSTVAINRIYDKFKTFLKGGDTLSMEASCLPVNGYGHSGSFRQPEEMSERPAIFVFTSGMMSRGSPSAHLASNLIRRSENGIFFTGYVAPNDLGYEILHSRAGQWICTDLDEQVWVQIQCSDVKKFSFSAHAHKKHLIEAAKHFNPHLTLWVHGDASSTERMSREWGDLSCRKSLAPTNRSPVLLARGGREVNESFSEFRAVVVTVGTSFLTTYLESVDGPRSPKRRITEKQLKRYLIAHANELPRLCAETNSLHKERLEAKDYLYFISGDNPDSRLCTKILVDLYSGSHFCEVVSVKGLVPDAGPFRESGMKNLMEALVGIVERHDSNAVIHATGGFKAQIAIATLIGILFRLKVFYLHEGFEDLVSLPQVPLDFDFEPLLASRNDFFLLLDGKEYVLNDERYARLPETLKQCFYKDPVQQKYNLSSLGRAMFNAFQKRMGARGYDVPFVVRGESGLWGPERDSLGQILNPVIGMILGRVCRYHDIILSFVFETSDARGQEAPVQKAENFMELAKQDAGSLTYKIEHPSVLPGKRDILQINTAAGMAPYLLKRLGRRVYP